MSWPLVKLGDICDLQNGYAFKSEDYIDDSNTLSCRMGNIRPGGQFDINYSARYLPDSFAEKYKQFLLADGDVVIAMTDLANEPKILGVPTVIRTNGKNILLNQRVGKLEIKNSEEVYFPYLKLVLNEPKVRAVYKKFAGGGLQINLGKDDLLSVEIPLPPLKEQKRIAAILDKADSIRRKRQQAIKLADDFLRSVFLEMFGDPVTNPKGFTKRVLKDFYINEKNGTKCGPFGSALKKDEYQSFGAPVWGMDNISLQGDFIDRPSLWVTEEKYQDLDAYSVLDGDVIISRAGTVGKMGVVRSQFKKSLISTNLIRLRFGSFLLPEYFVCLMIFCKGRVGRLKVGSDGAFTHMNTGVLDSLEFPYPPVELQNKFVKILNSVKATNNKNQSYKILSDNAFEAISKKIFAGNF